MIRDIYPDQNLALKVPTPVIAGATVTAPTAGQVIADTGNLTAGEYLIEYSLFAQDTTAVGKGLTVEHRNAANNATVRVLGGCATPDNQYGFVRRLTVVANERVRVIAGAAGTAASVYGARVTAHKIG